MSFAIRAPVHEQLLSTTSLLPDLEPFFGVGLALNLAYIALERFRYRERIRQAAKKKHDSLTEDGAEPPEDEGWLPVIRYLSLLPNEQGKEDKEILKRLKEVWAVLYRNWYGPHRDFNAAIIAAFFNGTGVAFASAHDMNFTYLGSAWWLSSHVGTGAVLWTLTAATCALPILNVWFGRSLVEDACELIEREGGDIAKRLQARVSKADPPKPTQ